MKKRKVFCNKKKVNYHKEGFITPNNELDNFMFNWKATYYKTENRVTQKTDNTPRISSFTKMNGRYF